MTTADDRCLRDEPFSGKRIVRCPHCGATFATSDRVLAKAQGWALCGECFEPFNALRATVSELPPEERAPKPSDEPAPPPAAPNETENRVEPSPSPFEHADAESLSPSAVTAAYRNPAALDRDPPAPPAARNPLAHAIALLLALLLFLTALGQAAWVAHPTLIRFFPELYPIGETICQALGCTLTPPADSERIQIDDARLIKEADPARYTLELTMTNRADYPMPWPHLALTLTDGLGRALVRKNLLPADWGAPQTTPFAPHRRIAVTLSLQIVESGIVGFEVVPFYP